MRIAGFAVLCSPLAPRARPMRRAAVAAQLGYKPRARPVCRAALCSPLAPRARPMRRAAVAAQLGYKPRARPVRRAAVAAQLGYKPEARPVRRAAVAAQLGYKPEARPVRRAAVAAQLGCMPRARPVRRATDDRGTGMLRLSLCHSRLGTAISALKTDAGSPRSRMLRAIMAIVLRGTLRYTSSLSKNTATSRSLYQNYTIKPKKITLFIR